MFAGVIFLLLASLAAAGEDPLQTLRAGHPRLIATDGDIERVRRLIKQNRQAGAIYRQLVEEAARIESAPPVEYLIIGPRLLAQSRRCLQRVYTLALLWRLDGERKYLQRALKELRAAAEFPDWNPSHFLDTAEMTHAFAIGYDWLYPALSEQERSWIRAAMVEKGLRPSLPIYEENRWWARARHNWNQVCNGGMGIGALAIADEEPALCRRILNYAIGSIPLAMRSYSPDGGWAEGPGYWHYATRYNVYLLAALESALGTDFGLSSMEGFDRAGHFRVYFCGPSGKTFNYADAGEAAGGAAEMFWLARKFGEPVYAWHQQRQLEDGVRPEALDLVWYQAEAMSPTEAGWPPAAYFQGVNAAFLRSSWEDPDAVFVGVKGGDNKANHSHLDLGSFVLDAGGARWALDFGPDDYNLPQYFGKLRWTYYRLRSESHNTVLIDGENQDAKAEAPITEHSFGAEAARVRIDLSGAYPDKLSKWERSVALTGGEVIIEDLIEARRPVEALWGMVTDAEVRLLGAKAELRKPGWVVAAEILSPGGARFDVVSTQPPKPQRQNEGTRKLVVRLPGQTDQVVLGVKLAPRRVGGGAD